MLYQFQEPSRQPPGGHGSSAGVAPTSFPLRLVISSWFCVWSSVVACSLQMPDESEVFASDGGRTEKDSGASGMLGDSGGRGSTSGEGGELALGGRDVGGGAAGKSGTEHSGGKVSNGGAGAGGVSSGGGSAHGGATGEGGAGGFDADDGLAAHFSFDEADGLVAANLKDATASGRYVGSCTHPEGQIGLAVRIRNLNSDVSGTSDYVELPAGLLSEFSATTIALWVRDLSPTRWGGRVLDFSRGTAEEIYFSPHQIDPETSVEGAHLGGVHGGESFVDLWSETSVFSDQAWHHVAVSWSASRIALYIDGSAVGSSTSPGVVPADLGETSPDWLGRTLDDAFVALYAEMDDLRIYDRALTATEVTQLYQLR